MPLFSAGDDAGLADKLNALSNVAGMHSGLTGTATTTSGTMVDFPAPSSVSFVKRRGSSETSIKASLLLSGVRGTVANDFVSAALRINGVDTEFASLMLATAGLRQPLVGFAIITGVPAGTYTVQMRWRRAGGTGTLTSDANDRLAIQVEEVGA